MSGMTIGTLAKTAGVNVETVRYYQRVGLVRVPGKAPRGIRRYTAQDLGRIGFIKRAQELGFALAEVRQLLELEDGQSCAAARSLAARKLETVEEKLADLVRLRRTLRELVASCAARRGTVACPIIATLSGRKQDGAG